MNKKQFETARDLRQSIATCKSALSGVKYLAAKSGIETLSIIAYDGKGKDVSAFEIEFDQRIIIALEQHLNERIEHMEKEFDQL